MHLVVFSRRLGFRLGFEMLLGLLGFSFAQLAGGGAPCRPEPRHRV
jgi:hypothetical protein